jgi:uncharacterized repeat protein (TIGR01451 family)
MKVPANVKHLVRPLIFVLSLSAIVLLAAWNAESAKTNYLPIVLNSASGPGNSVLPPINGGTVPRPRADLAITSTGRREGTRITFDLTVRNLGPLAAQTVVVENRLPGQVRGISIVPSKGSCAPRNRLLVCQLGTLARNEVVTIQIVSELQQLRSRSVRNIATVGSATRDLNRRNNRTVTVVTLR